MFMPQKDGFMPREDGCLRYAHVQVPPNRTPYSAPGSLKTTSQDPPTPPHHVAAAAPSRPAAATERGGADAAVCAKGRSGENTTERQLP